MPTWSEAWRARGHACRDRCLIVGEVAQSHDGSLGLAHAFIEAVAQTGADAIKFQTHIAAAESTPAEPWRVPFSRQDASRYDYWRRMEFSESEWSGLARHAAECGLLFISSPFSDEAFELLMRVGVSAFKVASGENTHWPLYDRVVQSSLPVMVSTGMSSLAEIDAAVERARRAAAPLALLQCTTAYPCPPERVGLNMLDVFRHRYACTVGLSDHSGSIVPSLAAATLGARVVEVHVALSREMFGPDVASSVTTSELRQMVEGIRMIERMLAHPVDKDLAAASLSDMRRLFGKSVVARVDLAPGTTLTTEHLIGKKPGTGIPAERLGELIGRRVLRPVLRDALLSERDLEHP